MPAIRLTFRQTALSGTPLWPTRKLRFSVRARLSVLFCWYYSLPGTIAFNFPPAPAGVAPYKMRHWHPANPPSAPHSGVIAGDGLRRTAGGAGTGRRASCRARSAARARCRATLQNALPASRQPAAAHRRAARRWEGAARGASRGVMAARRCPLGFIA